VPAGLKRQGIRVDPSQTHRAVLSGKVDVLVAGPISGADRGITPRPRQMPAPYVVAKTMKALGGGDGKILQALGSASMKRSN